MITTRIAPCEGLDNCLWVSNGIVEIAATLNAGIRLVFYGFCGRENMLKVLEEKERAEGKEQVGGWRMQCEPSAAPELSKQPIRYEKTENGVRLSEQPEAGKPIRALEISFVPGSSEVNLVRSLTLPEGGEGCRINTWSAAMLEEGGLAVLPQNRGGAADCIPNRTVALWPGTSMADPRIHWGQDHILVQQANMRPAKLGISCEEGWAAYFNMGDLMILRFAGQHREDYRAYADRGCNLAAATDEHCTELIAQSALCELRAGESVSFAESWTLYSDIPCPPMDEAKAAETLRGLL